MLQLQASAAGNPEVNDRLNEASSRISTVGRAYDRLAYNADYEKIELTSYLRDVLKDLEAAVSPSQIHFEAPQEIEFMADRAILLALIINELVTNAGKYAYPGRDGGPIWVAIAQIDGRAIAVSVRDEGVGVTSDFDPATSKRLGTRLVSALSKQLGAEFTKTSGAKAEQLLRFWCLCMTKSQAGTPSSAGGLAPADKIVVHPPERALGHRQILGRQARARGPLELLRDRDQARHQRPALRAQFDHDLAAAMSPSGCA